MAYGSLLGYREGMKKKVEATRSWKLPPYSATPEPFAHFSGRSAEGRGNHDLRDSTWQYEPYSKVLKGVVEGIISGSTLGVINSGG